MCDWEKKIFKEVHSVVIFSSSTKSLFIIALFLYATENMDQTHLLVLVDLHDWCFIQVTDEVMSDSRAECQARNVT